jgi:transforming growth factor-beta-induced protein
LELLEDTPDLSQLLDAIKLAGLDDELDDPSAVYTIFAPFNEAFSLLRKQYLDVLLTPPWILHLRNLLQYHIITGSLETADLTNRKRLRMINQEIITVGRNTTDLYLNNSIGINAFVIATDARAINGVAHVINGPMIPNFLLKTVTRVLRGVGSYTTFLSWVEMAGFVALEEYGPWTVLAPTNAAINKLPNNVTDFLESDAGKETLFSILAYHIIQDVVTTNVITNGASYTTVLKVPLTFNVAGNTTTINSVARLVDGDRLAFNGVSHGIDTVLIPPGNGPRALSFLH